MNFPNKRLQVLGPFFYLLPGSFLLEHELFVSPARQIYFLVALLQQNPTAKVVEPAEKKSRA